MFKCPPATLVFSISTAVETEFAPRNQPGVCKERKQEGMERAVAKVFRGKVFEARWHPDFNLHLRRVLLSGICLEGNCNQDRRAKC